MKNRRWLLLFCVVIFGNCAPQIQYPVYRFDENAYQKLSQNKSIYVVPVEMLSTQIPNLEPIYDSINSEIESYLTNHGYDLLPSDKFVAVFRKNVAEGGGIFDTQTGKRDNRIVLKHILQAVSYLRDRENASAVILPSLRYLRAELKDNYSYATWDGVRRKAQYSPQSRWTSMMAMTLSIAVIEASEQMVFTSRGGIDLIQKAIQERRSGSIVQSLATKQPDDFKIEDIREGIEIAFHPFIKSEMIGSSR
jgi:hypothetical protein